MSPVIIITGASRGIGLATAQSAVSLGASVVAVARTADDALRQLLESSVNSPGASSPRVAVVTGDVTDASICERVVDVALKTFGKIDAVVHNAGVIEPIAKIADADIKEWKRLMDVNLFSVLQLTQMTIPHLRKSKGRFVLVSSGAASKAYGGWSAYCCSKAAMNMLAAGIAAEEPEITTIAVRPGVVATEMQAVIRDSGEAGMEAPNHKFFVDLHKDGKLVQPEQPGHVLANLAVGPIPHELNGEFVSWDSDAMEKFRLKS